MTEPRPVRRAAAWLLFLGPFFFLSYGLTNWLASLRSDVDVIVFAWESSIPFLAWTIVPYWSIDILYALSPFLCRTRVELDRHGQRLLLVQIVSVVFFIAFPLQFSFERPESGGVFGALFTALGSFDKPFNQAPSLHIGLLIVIWALLARHAGSGLRWILHAWMTLIGISVLTTYQHHFIDIPTGAAVGLFALWLLPEGESPLRRFVITTDRERRKLAGWYGLGAAASAALASLGGWWLWLFWVTIALAIVALNYLAIGGAGFQKGTDGRLSIAVSVLLAPYLIAAWLNSRLWTRRHPQPVEVVDGVSIGRLPTARELEEAPWGAVIDLAAELPCRVDGEYVYYWNTPLLDLIVPPADALSAAAAAIEQGRRHGQVLVCCALGYSRSAAAIAAWLVATGRALSVEEAISTIRKARPSIVLGDAHCAALEAVS